MLNQWNYFRLVPPLCQHPAVVPLVVHKWNARLVTVSLSRHIPVSASLVKSPLQSVAPVHNTMRALCCIYWTCFATHTHKICFVTFYHKKEGWRTLLCNEFSPLSAWDHWTAGVQGPSFSYELLCVVSSTYNMLSQAGNNQENHSEEILRRHMMLPVEVHTFFAAEFWCWTLCCVHA